MSSAPGSAAGRPSGRAAPPERTPWWATSGPDTTETWWETHPPDLTRNQTLTARAAPDTVRDPEPDSEAAEWWRRQSSRSSPRAAAAENMKSNGSIFCYKSNWHHKEAANGKKWGWMILRGWFSAACLPLLPGSWCSKWEPRPSAELPKDSSDLSCDCGEKSRVWSIKHHKTKLQLIIYKRTTQP